MIRMSEPSRSRGTVLRASLRRSWQFPVLLLTAAAIVAGCGGGGSDPSGQQALDLLTQPPATATTRVALSPAPVVQLFDADGNALAQAGVTVSATLQSGSGSLMGTTTAQTNAQGQATFSNLSIAGTTGTKTLRFSATGFAGINSSNITLTAGAAAQLVANSTLSQTALLNSAVGTKPSVKVADLDGNGVGGVSVTFAVTAGGGSATGTTATSDGNGIATVGSWTVGGALGTNTMTATSAGLTGSPISFTATGANTISNFTITLVYLTSATVAQQAAFDAAKARWEQIITGDLADFTIPVAFNTTDCGAGVAQSISGTVDDVRIYVELSAIDGVGNILGAAGPCDLRPSGSKLPYVGIMNFDTADLVQLQTDGELNDVILHEMGHVLGYGTLWEAIPGFWSLTWLSGGCPANSPVFNGPAALAAYKTNGAPSATTVPVEDSGTCTGADGDGTRDSHWEESVFKSELMTGFISGTVRPLSATTIRSLEDLGYTVDATKGDVFDITTQPTLVRPGAAPKALTRDVIGLPRWTVDPTGHRRTQYSTP